MRYPYYNPNLSLFDILKTFSISSVKAENKLKEYFSLLTGKKYILITNSCRSSLYFAYKAAGIDKKDVITSPLTCRVSIDPIEESGNHPVFADINLGDLNIDTEDIEHRITRNTSAIQVIHLGGVSCNMDDINQIAKRHKLLVIEDCAQSFGSKYGNKYIGSFGDIACFSLVKNAYGIGGGILATDSEEIFTRATDYNRKLNSASSKLLFFRIIRSLLETYRSGSIGRAAYNLLLKIKGNRKSYSTIKSQLFKISSIELKISAVQINKIEKLHNERNRVGNYYYRILMKENLFVNNNYDPNSSSFTKFFLYHPSIESSITIRSLKLNGIEAMHLEQKPGSPIQCLFIKENIARIEGLKNYLKCHDHLISLPICEYYSTTDLNYIIQKLP